MTQTKCNQFTLIRFKRRGSGSRNKISIFDDARALLFVLDKLGWVSR